MIDSGLILSKPYLPLAYFLVRVFLDQRNDSRINIVKKNITSTFRRSLLVKSFLDALTVGGPGGTPRPIELHAHEPPRYIGDMLAWLHQAIPSEKENINTLMRACNTVDKDQYCQVSNLKFT